MPPVLTTARLTLREIAMSDLDFVAQMLGDPEVMRYYPKRLVRDESAEWIDKQRTRYQTDGHGFWLILNDDQPVGQAGILMQDLLGAPEPGLGYLLHRPYWGRGYAQEASIGCLDWAFANLDADRVICPIRPENTPSVRLAERLGLEQGPIVDFHDFDHRVYHVSRQDWLARIHVGMHSRSPIRDIASATLAALALGASSLFAQEPVYETPFETTSHKAFIEVTVNGSGPLFFAFDTGAPGVSINTSTAIDIGLDTHNVRNSRGGGAGTGATSSRGSHEGYVLTIADDPFIITPSAGGLIGLDHVSEYEGRTMDGIIGGIMLNRWVVEVDYLNETFKMFDADSFEYDGEGDAVEIVDFYGHIPLIRGQITPDEGEPIDAVFGIDSGSRIPLVLFAPFASENDLYETTGAARPETIGGGIGGEVRGIVTSLDELTFGEQQIQDLPACLSTDKGGFMTQSSFAGLIGGPVLARGKVIFDYPRRRMIIEAAPDAPAEYDLSGLFIIAQRPNYDSFRVMSVRTGSSAQFAGLRRGDVITHLNKRPASSYSLEGIRRILREADREVSLVFVRQDQRRSARFTTASEI